MINGRIAGVLAYAAMVRRLRYAGIAAALVVLLVLGVLFVAAGSNQPDRVTTATFATLVTSGAPATTAPGAASTIAPSPTAQSRDEHGLRIVAAAALPKEARDTLRLIDRGGPFPFDRDGIVFQNREGILPKKTSGYYREYTVITPGSDDRGARRIVAGRSGERYYTADHYESFVRVG